MRTFNINICEEGFFWTINNEGQAVEIITSSMSMVKLFAIKECKENIYSIYAIRNYFDKEDLNSAPYPPLHNCRCWQGIYFKDINCFVPVGEYFIAKVIIEQVAENSDMQIIDSFSTLVASYSKDIVDFLLKTYIMPADGMDKLESKLGFNFNTIICEEDMMPSEQSEKEFMAKNFKNYKSFKNFENGEYTKIFPIYSEDEFLGEDYSLELISIIISSLTTDEKVQKLLDLSKKRIEKELPTKEINSGLLGALYMWFKLWHTLYLVSKTKDSACAEATKIYEALNGKNSAIFYIYGDGGEIKSYSIKINPLNLLEENLELIIPNQISEKNYSMIDEPLIIKYRGKTIYSNLHKFSSEPWFNYKDWEDVANFKE